MSIDDEARMPWGLPTTTRPWTFHHYLRTEGDAVAQPDSNSTKTEVHIACVNQGFQLP